MLSESAQVDAVKKSSDVGAQVAPESIVVEVQHSNENGDLDDDDLFGDSLEIAADNAASPKASVSGPANGVHTESTPASEQIKPDNLAANQPTSDPSTAEAQIASSSEIDTTSSQPPAVSAPESDLRENPKPVDSAEAATLQEEKRELDASNDPELARTTQDTEQSQTPDQLHTSVATSPDASDKMNPQQKEREDLALRPSMENLDIAAASPTHEVTMENAEVTPTAPDTMEHVNPASNPAPAEPVDTEMADVSPTVSAKLVHGRDESDDDEPSAKRTKTAPSSQNGSQAGAVDQKTSKVVTATGRVVAEEDHVLTPFQVKELTKFIRACKSTNEGKSFKAPVVDLWPQIKENYMLKVSNPIDLSIIEKRMKAHQYTFLSDFIKDVDLVYTNTVAFNGVNHEVTALATKVVDYMYDKIPAREPPKALDKKKKPSAAPRERSIKQDHAPYLGTGHGQSPHPPNAANQTFALDPSGTPLIRRDSTKADGGRPKREIHPPKPRDLVYNSRPKKKKFAVELKFCEEVLNELKRPKYLNVAAAFLHPVDPVALGIPDYFKIIKNPMDIQTITDNLNNGHYETAKNFEADVRLMFRNCYRFNPEGTPVNIMGHDLERIFDTKWAEKAQYIADHQPSQPQSPESSAESAAEDESEDDDDDSDAGLLATLRSRLVDEQQKLIDVLASKKSGQKAMQKMQTEMVAIVQAQIAELENKQKTKKPKSKPVKKQQQQKKGVKAAVSSKQYRPKNIGFAEKEQISAGIVQLEGKILDQAIALLKRDVPDLNIEENPELDIDSFSVPTLSRLHDLIQRHCPEVIPKPEARAPRPQKVAKPKKNKPMSKHEQEKKIEHLKKLQEQFKRQGSQSDDAKPVMPCKFDTSSLTSLEPIGEPVRNSNVEQWLTKSFDGAAVEHDQMSSSGDESPSDSEED